MSNVEILILTKFKTALVKFLDELILWMPTDEELLTTRILVQDQLPIEEIMNKFIKFIKPHEDLISKRKDSFFLEDPEVFKEVKDQTKILSLKRLWNNPLFTNEDKNKAWDWMDLFMKLIHLYLQHTKKTEF